MPERTSRTETRGCIVCGKLHQLFVVYEPDGRLFDFKVMSANGRKANHPTRPLVACSQHTGGQVEIALARYAQIQKDDDD